MKRFIKIISVAVLCIVLCSAILPVSAAQNPEIIYKNDFSNGIDASMNYLKYGSYEVKTIQNETFLRCTPVSSGTRAFRLNFGPQEAKNVDITFRIRSVAKQSNTSAYYGLYFRSPSIPANAKHSYQLRLSAAKTSLFYFDGYADTTQVALNEDSMFKIKDCLWNNVKVSLRNSRIVVYVNGTQVFDIKDEYFPNLGGFGIMSVRYAFDIDDIVITQYDKKKLPEPTANTAPIWAGEADTDYKADILDSGQERLNLAGIGGSNAANNSNVNGQGDGSAYTVVLIILIVLILLLITAIVLVSIKLSKLKKANVTTLAGNENGIDDAQNTQ